jgi:exosortase
MNRIMAAARSALLSPMGVLGTLLGASLLWSTWPAWCAMAERWSTDSRYAHGYLIPAFAVVLLWLRRERLAGVALQPSWWGLPLILAGVGLQLAGGYLFFEWFEDAAVLPLLAGLCVLLGGRRAWRWAWPAIGFLVFMLPLPFRLEGMLSHPLQRVGTLASTYALQTLGLPAIAEGNIIHINDVVIGVEEVCSGLGMLFTFIAMASGVALLTRRPLPDRIVILLSAVPIAIIANVLRITVTGLLHVTVGSRLANLVFHDLAGWLMMPLALGMLLVELFVLGRSVEQVGAGTPGHPVAAAPAVG